jgi:acetamidase/formamidase
MQRIKREDATLTEFGADIEPSLEVDLGETFIIETIDNLFNTVKEPGDAPRLGDPPLAARQVLRGNPVAGPVYVKGVDAGDALVVELDAIDVRDYGWTGILPGVGIMDGRVGWEELTGPYGTIIRHEPGPSGTLTDGEAVMNITREVRWPLAPFLGTIVTAPERGIENTVTSQGQWGGNLDVRDISAGHRIILNTAHDGGLLFLGDVHASQGDSELTAIANETAADVTLRCDVLRDYVVYQFTLGLFTCGVEFPKKYL